MANASARSRTPSAASLSTQQQLSPLSQRRTAERSSKRISDGFLFGGLDEAPLIAADDSAGDTVKPARGRAGFSHDALEEPIDETHELLPMNASLSSGSIHSPGWNASERGAAHGVQTSGSTIWDAAFNFTNSIVGAGIIGLPYAFWQSGFVVGLVLLTLLAWLVDYTVMMLITDAKMSGQSTYQGLINYCYGRRGLLAISIFQFIFAYGAMCAYTVIIGDTLPMVFGQMLPKGTLIYAAATSRQFMILLCTLGVSLPLSMYRDISALAKTSAVSLVMILFIVLAVIVAAINVPNEMRGDPAYTWTFLRGGIFQSIGVISFAFVCHHNTFLIYGSLQRPTMDRFATVTHLSTGASLLLCLAMACGGYVVFTNKTKANILSNFAETDILVNFARMFFGMNMFLTFPLECFVCREVLFNYWWADESNVNEDMSQKATPFQHVATTLILVLSAMFIALSTCDLGFVLEITGGFAATVIAYILPAACYLKLSSGPLLSWKKAPSLLCIAFGFAVMVLSTILSIAGAVSGDANGSRKCS